MRTLLFVTLAALAVTGCAKSDPAGSAEHASQIPVVTVDQLDAMLAKRECVAVDANGEGTRRKLGIIPGAVLLSDSELFDPDELPADRSKTLVFYCANTQCGASDEAAAKAITAGYKHVKVLPEGIAGWVKAKKQTERI
jgi:rhodanese-related sulfurtransferase